MYVSQFKEKGLFVILYWRVYIGVMMFSMKSEYFQMFRSSVSSDERVRIVALA